MFPSFVYKQTVYYIQSEKQIEIHDGNNLLKYGSLSNTFYLFFKTIDLEPNCGKYYFLVGNKPITSSFPKQLCANWLSSEEVLGTCFSQHPSFQMQGDGGVVRRKYRLGVTAHLSGSSIPVWHYAKGSEGVQARENNIAWSLVSMIRSTFLLRTVFRK